MVSRGILTLLAFALFAAVAKASPIEEIGIDFESFETEEDVQRGITEWITQAAKEAGKTLGKKALESLKKEFLNVKPICIPGIIKNCGINPFLHPFKYHKCIKTYVAENKERCAKIK